MFKDIREIFTGKSASTAILRTHILVLILPIITSIAVQFAVGRLMQGEIKNAGFLVAENARNNFDNLIENVEKLSKQLSINDSIAIMYHDGIRTNNYNLKDAIYTLNYICKSTDDIDDIFIYNKDADIAITTAGRGNGMSLVENYYKDTEMEYSQCIQDMKELSQAAVRVVYSKNTKDVAYVEYLYPMIGNFMENYNTNRHDFPAVLIARINYRKLSLSEKIRKENPHTMLLAIDSDGNMIGESYATAENSELILKKCADKTDLSFKYKGQMYICSRSQKTDWIYVTTVPITVYNRKSYIITFISILSSLAIFLLGIKLILNFIRRTYGGFVKMSDSLSSRYDTSRRNIENLTEYVDRMIEERNLLAKKAEKHDNAEYYIALIKLFSGNRFKQNDPYLAKISNYMNSDKLVAVCCKMEGCSGLYIGSEDERISDYEKEKDALYIIENVVKELLEKDYAVTSAIIGSNLVFLVGNRGAKYFENNLYSAMEKYMHFLETRFAIKAVMSVGKTVGAYNDVYESYLEASEAMRYSFILCQNRVIVSENFKYRNDSYKITKEQRERFSVNLYCGNLVDVIDIIDEMYICNIKNSLLSYEMIKCFLVDVCGMFGDMVDDVSLLEKKILECNRIEDTRHIFHECIEKICSAERKKEDRSTRELVKKIESYIDKCYTDDNINVFAVANEFGFSREYISRLFKKYTNTTILDTIHNKRMMLAQKLLADGQNVNNVAYQVGYTNVNVFIRRFKQYTKMTPKEYATKCTSAANGNEEEE